jgi:hypothetical protein
MPEEANTARQVGSSEVRFANAAEHSRNVSSDVVLRSRSRGKNGEHIMQHLHFLQISER